MTNHEMLPPTDDLLWSLTEAMCDETITPEDLERLETLLRTDEDARLFYAGYMDLHGRICWRFRGTSSKTARDDASEQPFVAAPVASCSTPVPGFFGTAWHGTLNYFSEGWPLAYLIGTVIFAFGLTVASLMIVTHHVQIAQDKSKTIPSPYRSSSDMRFVGRVTGILDAKWSDTQTATILGANVALGRKYDLASGLLEITYNTGAKVILQGPVSYEVASKDSGLLSVGRLTARLDSAKPQAANQKSSLSTIHYPLFTIKTPTATVTDLGTEFAVEVTKDGTTTSHVFRGSVCVQMVSANGTPKGDACVLHENQSANIESNAGKQDTEKRITVFAMPVMLADFAREIPQIMPKSIVKTFDLVDAFAGGDGFSSRRGGGIDPTTGQATNTPPLPREMQYTSDQKYHRVESLTFVDGVFIPNGQSGPVQVDSAGHTFAEFPTTNSMTACYFLSGGEIQLDLPHPQLTELSGIDYALPGHGLLFVHSNKGITFNLEAIRKANPGCTIKRFLAVTGNTGLGTADLWILVDGRECFSRREISNNHIAMPVTIPVEKEDRFLTLAATDGGNGIGADWIIFGDPRLELVCPVPNTSPNLKGGSDKKK